MYLLDSDVFIQAKNRHYGFDIVPAWWDWLVQAHQAGRVFHRRGLPGGRRRRCR